MYTYNSVYGRENGEGGTERTGEGAKRSQERKKKTDGATNLTHRI
jgi:hypothetical protein